MNNGLVRLARVQLTEEEIEAAIAVLRSGQMVQGKVVEAFERDFAAYVGARYAVAVSSGTAALHVAYAALLQPGDEVLVPTFTHISTASMVSFAGGSAVFCDVNLRDFTIDLNDMRRKTSKRTKMIAPVHLFGTACDIDGIIAYAREQGLKIVWDACQAHGTRYRGRDVGSFDDFVCYSFYPTKNMTTGEGGIITTNDPELDARCRLLRSHGQERKYYHTMLGLNYRMTEMAAAVGLVQLKKLDAFIQARRRNAEYLTAHLSEAAGVTLPHIATGVDHTFHQYCVLLDLERFRCSRDEFVRGLREEEVEAAIHYPRPVHKQPVFSEKSAVTLPVSETVAERILSLPVHPALAPKELETICLAVKRVAMRMQR